MWNHSLLPRRWFGRLTLLAIVLTTVIGAMLLKTIDMQGLDALQHDVRNSAPVFALGRMTLIAGLILSWPSLLRFCQRRDWFSTELQQQLLAKRTRLAMWLITLELILGIEALNHFHSLFDRLIA